MSDAPAAATTPRRTGRTVVRAVTDSGQVIPMEGVDLVAPEDVPASLPYDPMTGSLSDPASTPQPGAVSVEALVAQAMAAPGGIDRLRIALGVAPPASQAPVVAVPGFKPGDTLNVVAHQTEILRNLERARAAGDINREEYFAHHALKEQYAAERQRSFIVPMDPLNPKMRSIPVQVNGYIWQIPIGQPCSAPESIYHVLLRGGYVQPQEQADLIECPVVAPAVRRAIEQAALLEGERLIQVAA